MFVPMLLFSTLDLIGTLNPVQENRMSLDLVFGNVRHKLFDTGLMLSNSTLNETEFMKNNFSKFQQTFMFSPE